MTENIYYICMGLLVKIDFFVFVFVDVYLIVK